MVFLQFSARKSLFIHRELEKGNAPLAVSELLIHEAHICKSKIALFCNLYVVMKVLRKTIVWQNIWTFSNFSFFLFFFRMMMMAWGRLKAYIHICKICGYASKCASLVLAGSSETLGKALLGKLCLCYKKICGCSQKPVTCVKKTSKTWTLPQKLPLNLI